MVSATDITLRFADRTLLNQVSFRIGARDRIGLVGSNGAGKSTLLRILTGTVQPDAGALTKARYVTVGYLPQEGVSASGRTLIEEAESVFADVVEAQGRLEEVQRRMGEVEDGTEEAADLLELYGELQHHLEVSNAFTMRAEAESVLAGLGFSQRDLTRAVEEFSGGWQMRIALARLLLQEPSLLLLDEPTNHLDLDSLQWLEEYIRGYRGALILVSHDRRFLDTLTERTFELSLGRLSEYKGNFSFYVEQKAGRLEQQRAAYRNQQMQIKQTERFIERFRYKATKARQVQSRLKALDKLERIELEDTERSLDFDFPPAPPAGAVVMRLEGVEKRYGAIEVFDGLDLEIDRGDKIALVGVNGAGKSTLARIIAGVEEVNAGRRIPGHNVVVSYFAQHQAEELDARADVLQTLDAVATGDMRQRLRTLLGCFLFSGDDVYKRVGVLSGGEKSRLALAKMLLEPANLLILDEPTNHLDMVSKGVLQEALARFDGTAVIVSHDRDFLDPIVTKVIALRPGPPLVYPGTISEFLEVQRRAATLTPAARSDRGARNADRDRKRQEAEERQQRYRLVKPVRDSIEKIEQAIERKEQRLRECEHLLEDPDLYRDGERAREVTTEYQALKRDLEGDYHRWNDLTRELERLSGHGGDPEERA
jgi:ATP-binding cassette subfamily F protein 3